MEVVFEGVLETSKSSSSKNWKTRLFVLKKQVDAGRSTLDFYKDTKKRWQKQVAIGVVSLWPWFTVSIAHNCSYKFAIQLTTSEQVFFLAASTLSLMNKWLYNIQTQRLLDPPKKGCYVFSVQAQSSESMNAIGLHGDCLLALTTGLEIQCALFPSRQVVAVWPFETLRTYWFGDGIFGFEAGRRSPRGEGKYNFVTKQDEEIYKTLAYYIKKAKRDSVTGVSSSKAMDERPPAPLPADTTKDETPLPSSESEEDHQHEDHLQASVLGYDSVNPSSMYPTKPLVAQRSGSLKSRVQNVDVSSTSPAYLRRIRTHLGHNWLHESVQQPHGRHSDPFITLEGVPPAALTCEDIQSRDPLEEDTYSHTVHLFPAPFNSQSTKHNVVGESLYNALVHTGAPSTKRKERTSSEDDTTLYDVAFPVNPGKGGRGVLPKTEGEYSTAYIKDQNTNVPRTRMPISKMPLGPEPLKDEPPKGSPPKSKPQLVKKKESEEGLTMNPLYGSQDNLLSAIAALDDSTEVRGEKQAINPVYGERKDVMLGQKQVGARLEETCDGAPRELEDSEETDARSRLHGESSPIPIPRDDKGYSKVNKKKKNGQQESGEGEGEEEEDGGIPPPIPERNYSYEGDNLHV